MAASLFPQKWDKLMDSQAVIVIAKRPEVVPIQSEAVRSLTTGECHPCTDTAEATLDDPTPLNYSHRQRHPRQVRVAS